MWDLIVSVPDQCLSFYFIYPPMVCSVHHKCLNENWNVWKGLQWTLDKRKLVLTVSQI